MNSDPTNPEYYNGTDCLDAIAAATVSLTGIEAVDTAQIIKYLWRWKLKNGVEDLRKALWYLNHLINLCSPDPPIEYTIQAPRDLTEDEIKDIQKAIEESGRL